MQISEPIRYNQKQNILSKQSHFGRFIYVVSMIYVYFHYLPWFPGFISISKWNCKTKINNNKYLSEKSTIQFYIHDANRKLGNYQTYHHLSCLCSSQSHHPFAVTKDGSHTICCHLKESLETWSTEHIVTLHLKRDIQSQYLQIVLFRSFPCSRFRRINFRRLHKSRSRANTAC